VRDAAWPDLVGTGAVLVVPLGATEQHGPHLPLTTDADIASGLVARLAAVRDDVVCAPVLAYGASGEHAGFAGTLSIGVAATEQVLLELGRSASDTFGRVLFVSVHGGNAAAVQSAVGTLRYEGRDAVAFAPRWRGDAHAGRVETSVMLALRPSAVRLSLAVAGNTASLGSLIGGLRDGGVRSLSPNGVLGDPAGASAAEGEELLAAAVADLVALLDDWPASA
jgi:creatinine amidohydrolase